MSEQLHFVQFVPEWFVRPFVHATYCFLSHVMPHTIPRAQNIKQRTPSSFYDGSMATWPYRGSVRKLSTHHELAPCENPRRWFRISLIVISRLVHNVVLYWCNSNSSYATSFRYHNFGTSGAAGSATTWLCQYTRNWGKQKKQYYHVE